MDMSPEAIRDQLTSEYGEKFTDEEADYAVSNLKDEYYSIRLSGEVLRGMKEKALQHGYQKLRKTSHLQNSFRHLLHLLSHFSSTPEKGILKDVILCYTEICLKIDFEKRFRQTRSIHCRIETKQLANRFIGGLRLTGENNSR